MSAVMTPEKSRQWYEEWQRENTRRYEKRGFSRNDHDGEIVKGCRLSWKQHKAKAYCLDRYRQDTGIQQDPKIKIEHEVKPVRIFYVSPEEKKKSRIKIKRDSDS
jgi:ribosomal protein L24